MARMSDRAAEPLATTPVTVNPRNQEMNSDYSTPKVSSDYEKCREERIKQNLERMQKLGIYDLSLKLRSIKPNTNRKNNKPLSTNQNKTPNRCIPPLPSSVPARRSSRLQNTPTVSYTEAVKSKKDKDENDHLIRENSRPEVYTEEHEKRLGDAKMEWTLFVDGYGKDGKKIYDQVRGKTCHQCRQKTLGHRTHCVKCNLVQGQFCGDCLYMRYGENVLEAMQNPDWICPVCRGICNCSLCRQAKGWAPTGVLYRKISSLGYKSVAHYLIETRQSDPNSEKTEPPICAKRSLPFSNEEVESEDGLKTSEKIEPLHDNVKLESGQEPENKNPEVEVKSEMMEDEKPSELQSSDEPSCNNLKLESGQELKDKNSEADADVGENENPKKIKESDESSCNNVKLESGQESDDKNSEAENENENQKKVNVELKNEKAENEVENSVVTPETRPISQKKRRRVVEPVLENSIAGRLRSRRKLI
ncbi:cell division cycle-associated protein 7-like [Cynara cardunculus var. scolymus]|uniref:Zinc-finger domain of monoamine-oxidase A repressor R1 n=1 Tax=Cynara cardunculus var. scolymus TaxID=59895 RepID=A0A103Y514_CYNCS|nr:cell division cycle-associated protein 7-like [Cynara cardunculus var. scolymus]KVI02654.1 Zinc-finger domain of monoamine-oxidase A repressor R1 [Cynara cardunculus var. scolymus]